MSNDRPTISARVPNSLYQEMTNHVEDQGEGYRMTDGVNDALKVGLQNIRDEPRWVPVASTLANISAIGCMVAGMFVLAGISNGAMIAVFTAFALIMLVSLSLRLAAPSLRGF